MHCGVVEGWGLELGMRGEEKGVVIFFARCKHEGAEH